MRLRIVVRELPCVSYGYISNINVNRTGRSLSSTAERTDVKLGPVISADVCGEDGEYLATATEDKTLRVWKMEDLSIVNER